MMKGYSIWVALLLALLLPIGGNAQDSGNVEILDSQAYTRDFLGRKIITRYSAGTAGDITDGTRAYLQIDLSTSVTGSGTGTDPVASILNGFVTVALPPGIDLDGEIRKYYLDSRKNSFEYMYSQAYPSIPMLAGMDEALSKAQSATPRDIVFGLSQINTALDNSAVLSIPKDKRLLGDDPSYTITGTSWLIPCNMLYQELVNIFDPMDSIEQEVRLRINVPIRLGSHVTKPHIMLYVGGLSAAGTEVALLPGDIPENALPLAPVPEPAPEESAGNQDEDNGSAAPQDGENNPERRSPPKRDDAPRAEYQDEAPDIIGRPPGQDWSGDGATQPPQPIPTLVFSYRWHAWETELDLSSLFGDPLPANIAPETLVEVDPSPSGAGLTDTGTIDPMAITEVHPTSTTVKQPETSPGTSEFELPETPATTDEQQPSVTETSGPAPSVHEVPVGTLPEEDREYRVPLKPITGPPSGNPQPYFNPDAPPNAGGMTLPPTSLSNSGNPAGEMVLIPEGRFIMGTASTSSSGDADEMPQSEVYLEAYYIDKYPVTNKEYHNFVISAGYKPEGSWDRYYDPGMGDMPVRGVSWNDAQAYAKWAGKRLPTEAEWEKAARGTDGRTYPWGEKWSSTIIPRGELTYDLLHADMAVSPYGVMAMCGVIWQWTASSLSPYPFNPGATGDKKVLRGGAYSNGRNIIRCANRYSEPANIALNTFGFRCVKDTK